MTSPLPQPNLSPEPQPQAQPVPVPAPMIVIEDPEIAQCKGVQAARSQQIAKLLTEMQDDIRGKNAMSDERMVEIGKLSGEAFSKAMQAALDQARQNFKISQALPFSAFKEASEQLAKVLPDMSVKFDGQTFGPSQITACYKKIDEANSKAR